MPRPMSLFLQTLIEDLQGTESGFIYELADEVRTLAVDHNVASQGHANRTLICILACKEYASCPISQRESRARSSWKQVDCAREDGVEAGSTNSSPCTPLQDSVEPRWSGGGSQADPGDAMTVTCRVSWTTSIGFDHDVEADSDDTMTRSPASGAGETKRMSL